MAELDLNRLRIFREIVLTGSFTRAAANLKQPKSRVSRQLAALEKELGTTLLLRTTRQFRLTPAGEALNQRAVPLLGQLAQALEDLKAGEGDLAGPVRVSVPEDLGVELFGRIAERFLRKYPQVQLELHVSNQVVDLVRDNFDFAVRAGKLKDSSLRAVKLGQVDFIPVMSPALKATVGELRRPEDLAGLPFLSFEGLGNSPRFTGPKGSRAVKLNPVFSCNNFFVLRSLAIAGQGFTMLAPFLAKEAMARGALVAALRDCTMEGAPLQAVYSRQGELKPRVRKFLGHVKQELEALW